MYLALLPDSQSLQYLKWISPELPGDAHVTLIHSTADYQQLPTSPSYLSLACIGFELFGFKTKVKVLKLGIRPELQFLRRFAESTLDSRGIKWSKQWAFSPHITLGLAGDKYKATFPPTLTFDRMEWR